MASTFARKLSSMRARRVPHYGRCACGSAAGRSTAGRRVGGRRRRVAACEDGATLHAAVGQPSLLQRELGQAEPCTPIERRAEFIMMNM